MELPGVARSGCADRSHRRLRVHGNRIRWGGWFRRRIRRPRRTAGPATRRADHLVALSGGFPAPCGTVSVPLDYQHPLRASITVAMTRAPAFDTAGPAGSLIFNPGGPVKRRTRSCRSCSASSPPPSASISTS